MKSDPTIDAIREVRHQISKSVDHDAKKLVEHYRKLQERHLERILSCSVETSEAESKILTNLTLQPAVLAVRHVQVCAMIGIKKSLSLAYQIYPASLPGATLGMFSYLIDPCLLLLLLSPVSIHLWSGFFYGADHGNSQWSWRSRVLASFALLQLPIVFITISIKVNELAEFIWMYGLASLQWTIFAWIVGVMALVDDWM